MSKFIHALQASALMATTAFIVTVVGVGTTAKAEDSTTRHSDDTSSFSDDRQNKLRQQREDFEAKKQEMKAAKEAAELRLKAKHEARQEKLSASQLEICKGREENINNRIARIADRSTKHLELFSQIAERTQAFYINNELTVDDYQALIDDVMAKKSAAETAVASISTVTSDFSCTDENPKLAIESFKTSLKTSIDVLKEYRTSVKNLIIAVKSAASSTPTNTDNTPAENQ